MRFGCKFYSIVYNYCAKKSLAYLEKAAELILLLHENFEVLINNGDCQKNTRARTDSAHKISSDRQSSNAQSSESSGCL